MSECGGMELSLGGLMVDWENEKISCSGSDRKDGRPREGSRTVKISGRCLTDVKFPRGEGEGSQKSEATWLFSDLLFFGPCLIGVCQSKCQSVK